MRPAYMAGVPAVRPDGVEVGSPVCERSRAWASEVNKVSFERDHKRADCFVEVDAPQPDARSMGF
jgi:hypothetical protein